MLRARHLCCWTVHVGGRAAHIYVGCPFIWHQCYLSSSKDSRDINYQKRSMSFGAPYCMIHEIFAWIMSCFSRPRGEIHQFMREDMLKIMPAALSIKIMPAFPNVLQSILAWFSCQHIWYSPNYHVSMKIMPGTTWMRSWAKVSKNMPEFMPGFCDACPTSHLCCA
jgi:hypothetical protein